MKKKQRAYNCLLFETHYTYFICIPFRSEISHPYAYHFKKSKRSQKHKSGLDYSKIVIIKNKNYVGNKDAVIDKDEFKETMIRLDKIKYEALKFVEDYVAHLNKTRELDDREFKRRYTYSSLQYFHDKLGVSV